MRLKNDPKYFVCVLSSSSVHTCEVIKQFRGFDKLKKGDPFDFSEIAYYDALGQGRIWQATADFKDGYIQCEERYNPEI